MRELGHGPGLTAEALELTGEYRRMVGRIDDVIERLAGS